MGALFLLWASQDLNPGPSGYENVANFEIPFFFVKFYGYLIIP